MNSSVNNSLSYGGILYRDSLLANIKKHSMYSRLALASSIFMSATLFMQLVPLSAFIPSLYIESIAIGFGLFASLLLLRKYPWRPFDFPMVAFLPISLIMLTAVQTALNLAAYWQQHMLVICYLIWATLLVMLGAELRREFDLKKIVPVFATTFLLMGLLSALSMLFTPWQPTLLGVGMALVSLVYLSAVKRIAKSHSIILGFLILGATAYAQQTSLISAPQSLLLFLQHSGVLAKESWHIFLANPLLGAGWGQFSWQDLQLANVYTLQTGVVKHPQNLFLQLLSETGIAGFAIVVIGLGFWLKRIWQSNANPLNAQPFHASQTGANLDKRWLYACLALLGIVALLNNGLAYAPLLGLFALILGLLEERIIKVRSSIGTQFRVTALLSQFSVFVLLAIGAMTLIVTCRQYAILEYWHNNTASFTQFKDQQIPPMLNTLGALRHQSLLTPYIDTGIVRALPNHADLIQDKLAINTQLIQHSPQAMDVYNQAQLLALVGDTKLAKKQLTLAINRHPDHLYDFTAQLLNKQSKEVLPLLLMIARHNKSEIAKERAQTRANKQAGINK
jgi:Virulence factor membrane-bound polymerase, C-terminal